MKNTLKAFLTNNSSIKVGKPSAKELENLKDLNITDSVLSRYKRRI